MVTTLTLLAGATEAIIPELSWPGVRIVVAFLAAAALTRRRRTPLRAAIAVLVVTGATELALAIGGHDPLLTSFVVVPVALYSLVRWASGRQAIIGLVVAVPFGVSSVVNDLDSDPLGAAMWWVLPPCVAFAVRSRAALMAQRLQQAKVDERRHIARELHDSVAHHVSGIAIQAKAARAILASNPGAAEQALSTVESEASLALEEMRAMVGSLRDDERPAFDPQPGIRDIVKLADGGARPHVDVELVGDLDRLSPAVDAGLYRMAQEGITNAHRHARDASSIVVRVADHGDSVELTVVDDGLPSSATAEGRGGYGLVGMAERAALLGGTFSAGPVPGRGWKVCAVIPKSAVRT